MLFRSGIILFYFSKWSYQIVNESVVKGTPREGHPAKEGLRLTQITLDEFFMFYPERVIQQKRD